jgi:hypothetical protein
MNIRSLEIKPGRKGQYILYVDGQLAVATWNKKIIEDGERFGFHAGESVIPMVIRELDKQFSLSEDEEHEYEKTLRYILED